MQRRDITLIMSMDTAYGRDILRGIAAFRAENPWFRIRSIIGSPNVQSVLAREGRCDGVIGHLNHHELLQHALKLSPRVVSVSNVIADPGVPRVVTDDVELGRMAAAHLAECGLRHLAMLPERFSHYVQLRMRGFLEECARRGLEAEVFHGNPDQPFTRLDHGPIRVSVVRWSDAQTLRWLKRLPRPFGLCVTTETLGLTRWIFCSAPDSPSRTMSHWSPAGTTGCFRTSRRSPFPVSPTPAARSGSGHANSSPA